MALGQVGLQPEARGVEGDSFGEVEDGFDVELVFPFGVAVELGQGHGFADAVEVLLVGGLVDGFLEDEGFDELVFAALEVEEGFLGGGALGGEVLFAGLPDVEDDSAEEGEEFGPGAEALEEGEEAVVELLAGDVGPVAVGFGRAVIVGVALIFALGPGAGEGFAAVAADQEAAEGEVGVVALFGDDQAIGAEEALALPEGLFVDQGRPVAGSVDAPGGLDDAADVEPVGQHLSPFLGRQLAASHGPEASRGEVLEDFGSGVEAGGEALEAKADEGGALGVEAQGLAVLQVAEGGLPDPLAAAQGFLHAGFGAAAADFVVELREGGEDAFHELAGGGLVDRLADGAEGDAQGAQVPADDGVIEGVAGEAVEVADDEDVDFDGALVLLAQVGEGRLQLGAVGGAGGLAALQEDAVDVPAVQAAEGFALIFLDGEGEVVGLFFAADAAVNDRPERGHPVGSFGGGVVALVSLARKHVTVMSARP